MVSKDDNNPLPPWTDNADPTLNTFDYDLWRSGGYAWPLALVASDYDNPVYNWLDLTTTGLGTIEVKSGDMFAVLILNDGVNLDSDRLGLWTESSSGYPGWKYYENGRIAASEPGWWVRMYTWDFAVAVDITGDRGPLIGDFTVLGTSHRNNPNRVVVKITDDNPSGGENGVASVNLAYTFEDYDTVRIPMISTDSLHYYVGEIPALDVPQTTKVTYWVEAEDVNGNKSESKLYNFITFCPSQKPNLLVFNGPDSVSGFPQSYYFGSGDYPNSYAPIEWNHDSWAFGALTEELVNNYDNIIEITTFGPASVNNDVIRAWLEGDGNRNYLLAGDEWLGAQYGWNGTMDIPDGDFAKDIMGINVYHSDINYAGSGDQQLPSDVNAVEGSLLGGELFTLHKQVSADSGWTSSIQYNPTHEVGADNWLDGVEFTDGVEVDMTGIGNDGNTYNIGGHRTLTAGNKIAFLAFDPLSLNSNPEGEYYWYGFTYEAPQVQALLWFDAVVSVNEKSELPETFSLSQNYPNPFNPSTTIKYSIPVVETRRGVSPQTPILGGGGGLVTLKVYDILGREVATLVNKEQMPGNYEVQFTTNGGLTSGVYFYQLKSGSFSATKKFLLLK